MANFVDNIDGFDEFESYISSIVNQIIKTYKPHKIFRKKIYNLCRYDIHIDGKIIPRDVQCLSKSMIPESYSRYHLNMLCPVVTSEYRRGIAIELFRKLHAVCDYIFIPFPMFLYLCVNGYYLQFTKVLCLDYEFQNSFKFDERRKCYIDEFWLGGEISSVIHNSCGSYNQEVLDDVNSLVICKINGHLVCNLLPIDVYIEDVKIPHNNVPGILNTKHVNLRQMGHFKNLITQDLTSYGYSLLSELSQNVDCVLITPHIFCALYRSGYRFDITSVVVPNKIIKCETYLESDDVVEPENIYVMHLNGGLYGS